MTAGPVADRLAHLRRLLAARGLDGLVVPRADLHQSEVAAPHDDRLAFLTGFSGSAGLALVLADRALIFVDGRYDIQVRREVDEALFEIRHLHDDPLDRWLARHGAPGWRIGIDEMLIAVALHKRLAEGLDASGGALVPLGEDLFDAIWPDRPAKPLGAIRPMPVAIAGEAAADKRARIARGLAEAGADLLVETLPDNIAWLLNMRGSDVAMNPVPQSCLVLRADGGIDWFVDRRKLGTAAVAALPDRLEIADPDAFAARVEALAAGRVALVDPGFAPVGVSAAIERGGGRVLAVPSPLTLAKALKNEIELADYRACHVEDGAALTDFLAFVAREAPARAATPNPLREIEAEAALLALRARRAGFIEPSFRSISATGANAALCHYAAAPETDAAIDGRTPYLIDSGGQYETGTTDVTRTLFTAAPEAEVRRTYTAVLKGFVALMTARMPIGTFGHQLDAFARRPLWDLSLDYDHGTGHGVGHRLLVHEYPHRFAKVANPYGLEPGNIMTVEPGYYAAGRYGLRIENQVEVVADAPGFCRFRSLTLAPIDLAPVDPADLDRAEIAFLDAYHRDVRAALRDRVAPETLPYLLAKTEPLGVGR